MHGHHAWPLRGGGQLERGIAAVGLWDEAHSRSGFWVSMGHWRRRALPTRKPLWGRETECLLPPVALQGTPEGCAPAQRRAGAAVGGRRCSALASGVFPSGRAPVIFPHLSSPRAALQPLLHPLGPADV